MIGNSSLVTTRSVHPNQRCTCTSMDGNMCQMEAIMTAWELKIIPYYGDPFQKSHLCNWSPHANGLNSYNRSGQGPILYVDDTDAIIYFKLS